MLFNLSKYSRECDELYKICLCMQLRENAEQYSGLKPRSEANKGGGLNWRGWLGSLNWRRDDHESVVCYALFFAVFVADFSLLSLAFPLSLLCYALLAQPPSRRFWQVPLMRLSFHTPF